MSEEVPTPATKPAASKTGASKASTAKKPAARASTAKAPTSPSVETPPVAPEPAAASDTPPPPVAPVLQAPRMLESEARTWSMLIYVLALVLEYLSAGTLAFLVPLIIWLIHRDRSALVDWHGKQSLNMHLTSLTVIIGGVILGIVSLGFGFFITIPIMLMYILFITVMSIVAAVKASNGEYYQIPLVIRFIR